MSLPAYADLALTRDRQAFLDVIHTHERDKECAYEAILDDLILWSLERPEALRFGQAPAMFGRLPSKALGARSGASGRVRRAEGHRTGRSRWSAA